MSMKTYFSNRIYKNTLSKEYIDATSHALMVFNRAKHFSFSHALKEKRSGQNRRSKSIHLTVKERFDLNDYYANSAVQEANALQKSLNELNKLYLSNKETQVKSVKNKIKKEKSRLATWKKIKMSFIKGRPTLPKNSNVKKLENFFIVQFKKKTDIYYHAYQFEHECLDREIIRLQTRIGFLTFKQNRFEQERKDLKTKVTSVVFGTKKLFKSQYTIDRYQSNHLLWAEKWKQSRSHQMTISGRKDSSSGNFVFTYNPSNQSLHYKTPSGLVVVIESLNFTYGQEQIEVAILKQTNCKNKKKYGKPMAWSIEDRGGYYIFKCMIDEEQKEYSNYSKSDGIVGIDCNVDHFAVSNINLKGQLISSWSLKFDIFGKTSNQITKIIEVEAVELVNIALRTNKPIAVEKLDTTSSKIANHYKKKKQTTK